LLPPSTGFGVGVGGVVIPVLLSEIAPRAHRGTITTMHQLLLTVGIFLASVVGYGLVMYVNHGWQYLQVRTGPKAYIYIILYIYI
jgi:MFS family permease